MSKPNPYCECHRWDQPGGICAYCTGYTDGWTTETAALRRERDALAEHLRAALHAWAAEANEGDGILEANVPVYEAAKAAGTGVG